VLENPTAGVKAEEPTERLYETNFEIADLNVLFASPWFAGSRSASSFKGLCVPGDVRQDDHCYWAFLCMLFSGARVSELGGIHTNQVHILSDDDGFFEFDWTEGPHGRRVKNATSVRIVPIHRELVKLGFMNYARRMKELEHERLFPGWLPQRRRADDDIFKNDFSPAPFLKRFRTYLVWLGIKRPGISAKSFRASWETATVGTLIDQRSLLRITGRAQGGSLDSYIPKKVHFEQLKPSVDQVSFDGLMLDHLYSTNT
jgi:hypothetical protein